MLLVAANTFLHYLLHTIDLRCEDPWENKTIYMRYVDIAIGKAIVVCGPAYECTYVRRCTLYMYMYLYCAVILCVECLYLMQVNRTPVLGLV